MSEIKGYTQQTPAQIQYINFLKESEERVLKDLQSVLNAMDSMLDKRWMAIAKTHFQEGFMAAVRAVARPLGD